MTAVILVGLMVALAFVLAITWIEPRVLGVEGHEAEPPADLSQRRLGAADTASDGESAKKGGSARRAA